MGCLEGLPADSLLTLKQQHSLVCIITLEQTATFLQQYPLDT